uniref:Large ribosomal subunit protein P2 n=1 Tax=Globodera pallida TaxID=36090 RepID=A0A183C7I2_GLOPA
MKYVAAYVLATLGGRQTISVKELEDILMAGGLAFDVKSANCVVAALQGKSLDDVLKEGEKKLASVPSGGGGSAPATSTTSAPSAAVEKKEEKKKEEEKEESDDDMGFGLFD